MLDPRPLHEIFERYPILTLEGWGKGMRPEPLRTLTANQVRQFWLAAQFLALARRQPIRRSITSYTWKHVVTRSRPILPTSNRPPAAPATTEQMAERGKKTWVMVSFGFSRSSRQATAPAPSAAEGDQERLWGGLPEAGSESLVPMTIRRSFPRDEAKRPDAKATLED